MGNKQSARKPYIVNSKEKILLQNYWPTLKQNHPRLFLIAWVTSMEAAPNIKATFGLKGDQDPVKNKTVRQIVKEVEKFFRSLVIDYNLETEKCYQACKTLGGRHVSYSREAFNSFDWHVFSASILHTFEKDLTLDGKERKELLDAVRKFMAVIIEQVSMGYKRQLLIRYPAN